MQFNLPTTTFVNKFIAKNKFFDKTVVNSKLKNEFSNKIQRITWKYKLAENTIGISTTENVEEIEVFDIELKARKVPKSVLKIIDKTIPYPILYIFRYNEDICYGITLKNDINNYYFSEWNTDIKFDFRGLNLEKVYQNIVKKFIVRTEIQNKDFNEIIENDKRISTLEKEINALKNKIRLEKQPNKQFFLNKQLNEKKEELKNINN